MPEIIKLDLEREDYNMLLIALVYARMYFEDHRRLDVDPDKFTNESIERLNALSQEIRAQTRKG